MEIVQHPLDGERTISRHEPGEFTSEMTMISGHRWLVIGRVTENDEFLDSVVRTCGRWWQRTQPLRHQTRHQAAPSADIGYVHAGLQMHPVQDLVPLVVNRLVFVLGPADPLRCICIASLVEFLRSGCDR
jgi:hypothetical protein